jgi:peptidoglycan hydrolase CwlO-like protein
VLRDILSILAVPVSALITYILGHMAGRKKTEAEVDKIELDNMQEIVAFYKRTFDDLKLELGNVSEKCKNLSAEIEKLRFENVTLKRDIHNLNEQLKKYQKTAERQ